MTTSNPPREPATPKFTQTTCGRLPRTGGLVCRFIHRPAVSSARSPYVRRMSLLCLQGKSGCAHQYGRALSLDKRARTVLLTLPSRVGPIKSGCIAVRGAPSLARSRYYSPLPAAWSCLLGALQGSQFAECLCSAQLSSAQLSPCSRNRSSSDKRCSASSCSPPSR